MPICECCATRSCWKPLLVPTCPPCICAVLQEHGAFLYISVIGTRPEAQGKGYGSAIVTFLLQRADEVNLFTYVEATSERSRAFYARFGFELLQVMCLPMLLQGTKSRGLQPRACLATTPTPAACTQLCIKLTCTCSAYVRGSKITTIIVLLRCCWCILSLACRRGVQSPTCHART